jgi:hypothetical protein
VKLHAAPEPINQFGRILRWKHRDTQSLALIMTAMYSQQNQGEMTKRCAQRSASVPCRMQPFELQEHVRRVAAAETRRG